MPFRRLAAVEGRSDDVVHLPGCLGGTVAVPPPRDRPGAKLKAVVRLP